MSASSGAGARTANGVSSPSTAGGLEPDTEYALQLLGGGETLCDPWPLRTFPSPSAQPESVRFLAYTCAGGHQESGFFLPLAVRRRLLRRALSFRPRALIAIGDHIYWDQRTVLYNRSEERGRRSREFYERIGWLDLSLPVLGTSNETSIKAAVGPQIAELYGVMLRSTPSYFVSDDHDYYENDDADPQMVTLPPDRYQVEFARFTRNAFLPEFLPDVERPLAMSGTGAGDREPGISEAFGTFRYGRLAEVLIYDCARYLSAQGRPRRPRAAGSRALAAPAHPGPVGRAVVPRSVAPVRLVGWEVARVVPGRRRPRRRRGHRVANRRLRRQQLRVDDRAGRSTSGRWAGCGSISACWSRWRPSRSGPASCFRATCTRSATPCSNEAAAWISRPTRSTPC